MSTDLVSTCQGVWDTIKSKLDGCPRPSVAVTNYNSIILSWSNPAEYIELEFMADAFIHWYYSSSKNDSTDGNIEYFDEVPSEFYEKLKGVIWTLEPQQ